MLASAFHTSINGWDVIVALAVLLVAVMVERTTALPAVIWTILFGVVLFGLALTVRW